MYDRRPRVVHWRWWKTHLSEWVEERAEAEGREGRCSRRPAMVRRDRHSERSREE